MSRWVWETLWRWKSLHRLALLISANIILLITGRTLLWLWREGGKKIRSGICKMDKNVNCINFCQSVLLWVGITWPHFQLKGGSWCHDAAARASSQSHCRSYVILGLKETPLLIVYYVLNSVMKHLHTLKRQKLKIPCDFTRQRAPDSAVEQNWLLFNWVSEPGWMYKILQGLHSFQITSSEGPENGKTSYSRTWANSADVTETGRNRSWFRFTAGKGPILFRSREAWALWRLESQARPTVRSQSKLS